MQSLPKLLRQAPLLFASLSLLAVAQAQCTKDTDCKGDRICERGICTAPVAAAPSDTASSTVEPLHDRVVRALQDQLKCDGAPEPGKALRALQSNGYIGKKPKLAIDGMTIWEFTKPVYVFGYRALEVTGYEDKPDGVFFWRGPGTSPSINIAVVVEGDPKAVESYLKRAGGIGASISRATYSKYLKPATEITCTAR